MRILVTGASGFIGQHAVRHLAALGHTVVATGRNRDKLMRLREQAAQLHVADLADAPLTVLLRDCDAVVHSAALSAPWGSARAFQRTNVHATRRLAQAARLAGVERFIHIGSPSIYFRFADQYDLDETFQPPRRWITEYARSKWEAEEALRALGMDAPHTLILRPRAVFGEGDQAILPRLLNVAAQGRFPLVGGGRALIDITHVDNVVHAIALALRAEGGDHGSAYNITNGEPVRVRELLQKVFDAVALPVRMRSVPRTLALALASIAEVCAHCRTGCPEPRLTRYGVGVIGYSQTLDISAARHALAYAPVTTIDDGIARFAAHWHGHRTGV